MLGRSAPKPCARMYFSFPRVRESPVAYSVTSWPRATSASVRTLTSCSCGPVACGGVAARIGEIMAIFMAAVPSSRPVTASERIWTRHDHRAARATARGEVEQEHPIATAALEVREHPIPRVGAREDAGAGAVVGQRDEHAALRVERRLAGDRQRRRQR